MYVVSAMAMYMHMYIMRVYIITIGRRTFYRLAKFCSKFLRVLLKLMATIFNNLFSFTKC